MYATKVREQRKRNLPHNYKGNKPTNDFKCLLFNGQSCKVTVGKILLCSVWIDK